MKGIIYPENKKAKLLIIDDERDLCVYLKSLLERTGKFEVWSTTSPDDGINLAKSVHPDLILLDIIMPEMDGSEVAERLRNDSATRDILVVFFSVLARPGDVNYHKGQIGGYPFISKPIAQDKLVTRLEALLRKPASN